MDVKYTDSRSFTPAQLQGLFQSVGWISGNYPERLKTALMNCETVFTAWDGDVLVGLINAIDDGELTAYVHYLCIRPEYQSKGIGKELLGRVKEKYKDYLHLFLIAENEPLIKYYEKNGFRKVNGAYSMAIQKL